MSKQKRPMWVGPTAKLVERIYGSNSPASVFLTEARVVVHTAKQTKPPIDPLELAAALNVRVEERKMALDGFLEKDPDGNFRVVLSKDANVQRKRFTLCHELAHTFFFEDLARSRAFRREDQYDPEEERLCNLAAAEMLMPFAMFNRDLLKMKESDGITPNTVFKLMERYGVSLQAVSNRVTWIVPDSACIIWRCEGKAINPEWATPGTMKRVVLCQTGRTSVEKASSSPGRLFRAPDSFYGNDQRLIRRWTASRQMRSGHVFSVLTRKETGTADSAESNQRASSDNRSSDKLSGAKEVRQLALTFD